MKKYLLVLAILSLTIAARAQYSLVDLVTRSTNTTSSSGALISIPAAGITNSPYSATNPAMVQIGDSIPTAFGKVNTALSYLASATRTNGATGSGQVPISTNVTPGYFWGILPIGGGGSTNSAWTNSGVIFQFNSLGQLFFSNTITHAYTFFGTNGHPVTFDEYGGIMKFTTNSFVVVYTNGFYLVFTNGFLNVNSSLSVNASAFINNLTVTNPLILNVLTNSELPLYPPTRVVISDSIYPLANGIYTNSGTSPGVMYTFSQISPSVPAYIIECFSNSATTFTPIMSTNGITVANTLSPIFQYPINNQTITLQGAGSFVANMTFFNDNLTLFSAQIAETLNALQITSANGMALNTNTASGFAFQIHGSENVDGDYFRNGTPIGQIAGVTNSSTGKTSTNTTTFDPATLAYFATCNGTISTNFNGYFQYQFVSQNPNYFSYNTLPAGSYFLKTAFFGGYFGGAYYPYSGQLQNPSFYVYTVLIPNIATTVTNVPPVPTQTLTAVNDLVANLKSSGLWLKATNIYPFAGGNPTCNANNLLGSTYTITWHDYLTSTNGHGSWGVSNSLGSGWGDTGFKIPSANSTNLTMVTFVMHSGGVTNYQMSAYDGTNYASLASVLRAGTGTNLLSTINTPTAGTTNFVNNTNGTFFSISRTSSTNESGLIDYTNFYSRIAVTNGLPSSNIVLFARSAGDTVATNLVLGFAGTFVGLTTNELAQLQSIILQYENEMGRLPGGLMSTNILAPVPIYLTGGVSGNDGSQLTNLASIYRAGTITVATSATSTPVIFSNPFNPSVGTNYAITFGSASGFVTSPNPTWSSKTTNGFTIITTAVVGGGLQDYSAIVNQ